MSAQQHQDPAIYKHLSPKTQGFLRASAEHRFEAARLNDDTMSNEQTYVVKFFPQLCRIGGVANFW